MCPIASMSEVPAPLERVPSGIAGLDVILGGGLFRGGIYIATGKPGSGKTIFANQVAFAHARAGGRVVYATLLAETHGRMLAQLRGLSFFDEAVVGSGIVYLNGLGPVMDGGLEGLLQLVRRMVRDQRATLLVIDGIITAEHFAKSPLDYKRFIAELQVWVATVSCTVLFLSSGASAGASPPEHTMVDGIFELVSERIQVRNLRHFTVTKFRGSGFVEGQHLYTITSDGLAIYPRLEATLPLDNEPPSTETRTSGVPGLDAALGGGFAHGSTTLVLGSSGTGKTILGLQFLAEGARRGEVGLYFGFYEPPATAIGKAERLGLDFARHVEEGRLYLRWFRPAELFLDVLVAELLATIKQHGVVRVFIDGFVGFRSSAYADRLSAVFSALSDSLISEGVTTLISEETRELFVQEVEVPTANVSAVFHNIVFLRHVEQDAELVRLITVMKVRDRAPDRRLWQYEIEAGGLRLLAPFQPQANTRLMAGRGGQRPRPATRATAKHTKTVPSARRKKGR